MYLTLKFVSKNDIHTAINIFVNHALVGTVVLRNEEVDTFIGRLDLDEPYEEVLG